MVSFFRVVMILVFGWVAVNSTAFASSSPVVKIQWEIEDGGNGHYYEAVSVLDGITWNDANAAATAKGGYLVTITSAEENAFVFDLINDDAYWRPFYDGDYVGPWIGGFQPTCSIEPDGNWQWVTGESFSLYNNWGPSEPNNYKCKESYIHFYESGDPKSPLWNDTSATAFMQGYVIESVPEPSTFLMLMLGSFSLLFYRRCHRTS